MGYKYFNLNQPPTSAGDVMINEIQANIYENFNNASTYFTIQEETFFASGSFQDTEARINRGINAYTGDKLGDDFKYIIFKDLNHATMQGYKYFFDNDYWIVTNTEIIKNLAASCLVRKCNNMLRWVDSNGNLYSEPCFIEYKISRPRDQTSTTNPVIPEGYISVTSQQNAKTRKIRPNQRFLFGNPDYRICYKIFGDGVNNFLNIDTTDDYSARTVNFSMGGFNINEETDDLVNGYANRWLYQIPETTTGSRISLNPSDTSILESGSQVFAVTNYYNSGSLSGSFIFSINDNLVPPIYYTFNSIDGNHFSVKNNAMYPENDLNIKCNGSSGSRLVPIHLRGAW